MDIESQLHLHVRYNKNNERKYHSGDKSLCYRMSIFVSQLGLQLFWGRLPPKPPQEQLRSKNDLIPSTFFSNLNWKVEGRLITHHLLKSTQRHLGKQPLVKKQKIQKEKKTNYTCRSNIAECGTEKGWANAWNGEPQFI